PRVARQGWQGLPRVLALTAVIALPPAALVAALAGPGGRLLFGARHPPAAPPPAVLAARPARDGVPGGPGRAGGGPAGPGGGPRGPGRPPWPRCWRSGCRWCRAGG